MSLSRKERHGLIWLALFLVALAVLALAMNFCSDEVASQQEPYYRQVQQQAQSGADTVAPSATASKGRKGKKGAKGSKSTRSGKSARKEKKAEKEPKAVAPARPVQVLQDTIPDF